MGNGGVPAAELAKQIPLYEVQGCAGSRESHHSPFPSFPIPALLLHRSNLNGPPVLRPEVRAIASLHMTVISKFEMKQRLVDKA